MVKKIVLAVLAGVAYFIWKRGQEVAEPLTGKVVVVTGASAGIGKATARAFAAHGATVVLVARRENLLNDVQESLAQYGVESLVYPADMSKEDDLQALISDVTEKYGHIDVLVNNAGLSIGGHFHQMDAERIRRMIDLNLTGLIRLSQIALPGMLERRSGHIVNVSSVAGVVLSPGQVPYATTKAAVNAFSDSLRRELQDTGVRVSAVLPGWTQTDMIDEMNVDLAREALLVNPLFPIQQVDYVADQIVDAVRFNRPFVVLGGLLPRSASIALRAQARVLDFVYINIFDRDKVIAAQDELGTV